MSKPENLLNFLQLAPTWWLEALWLTGENSSDDPNDLLVLSLQTEGDLQILYEVLRESIMNNDDTLLHEVSDFFKFIMASTGVMGHLEFAQIPLAKDFKEKYGPLYRTMEIWAWG